MSEFLVSARKYRPTTFDLVVGQKSIVSTLRNAIQNEKIAQAYLFCGPRGVGKTTCARILAKVINDESYDENSLEEFSFNVFELDAASNNKVDDIRNLIEQVRIPPQTGRYKVYIIDEVHMLSTAAFNAFLKTLEEPPKHAIFILATTEKHKILPTILSRCQIFDFNRINIQDIVEHLQIIAEKEGITVDKNALFLIAQKADGGMRDALSMFDQLASFTSGNITYESAVENLNILDYTYYFKVTQCIIESNIYTSLLLFNDILKRGFDGHHFINGLAEHIRNLLVCTDNNTVNLLEVTENAKDQYIQQAKEFTSEQLMNALEICQKADTSYASSKNKRLTIELALMQLCSIKFSNGAEKKNFKIIPPPSVEGIPIKKEEVKTEPKPLVQKEEQPVVVEEQEQPKINTSAPKPETVTPKKSFSPNKVGTISINLSHHSETKKVQEPAEVKYGNNEISAEDILSKWNDLLHKIDQEGKLSLHTTLVTHPPIIDKTNILIKINNKAQEEELTSEKSDILGYLRSELNNGTIQLHFEITDEPQDKKAYTPEEKFQKLIEKNPHLQLLKDKFDLEINY